MINSTRIEAFLIHLAISGFIFVLLYIYIRYFLYPGELFYIDGGKQGLVIIAVIDLVLGPLLTLVVYKKGKQGLKRDLSLIGIFQAACLIAGMCITIGERPLAIVLSYDGFHTVGQSSLDIYGKDRALYAGFAGDLPKTIYVSLPKDQRARLALQLSQLSGGPLYIRSELLKPFVKGEFQSLLYSEELEAIIKLYPAFKNSLYEVDRRFSTSGKSVSYLRLAGRYASCYIVFNNDTFEIIETLPTGEC